MTVHDHRPEEGNRKVASSSAFVTRKRNRRLSATLEERFWAKVEKTDGCWRWTGSTDRAGYGRLQRGRQGEGVVKAHRLSYELNVGPIPEGLHVCHHCDNPPCCNPAHLFVGTDADNLRDASAKGRMARPLARDPVEVCAFYDAGHTQEATALHFGVSETTVWRYLKHRESTEDSRKRMVALREAGDA